MGEALREEETNRAGTVFLFYGRCAAQMQLFEDGLLALLTLNRTVAAWAGDPEREATEELERLLRDKVTAGGARRLLEESSVFRFSRSVHGELSKAVARRNEMTHRFFVGRDVTSDRGYSNAMGKLERELRFFQRMNALVGELMVQALQRMGLDRGHIERGAPPSVLRAMGRRKRNKSESPRTFSVQDF